MKFSIHAILTSLILITVGLSANAQLEDVTIANKFEGPLWVNNECFVIYTNAGNYFKIKTVTKLENECTQLTEETYVEVVDSTENETSESLSYEGDMRLQPGYANGYSNGNASRYGNSQYQWRNGVCFDVQTMQRVYDQSSCEKYSGYGSYPTGYYPNTNVTPVSSPECAYYGANFRYEYVKSMDKYLCVEYAQPEFSALQF